MPATPAEDLGITRLATAARDVDIDQRRWVVRGLIGDGLKSGCFEREIFLAAYGEESGRDYWRSWLSGPMTLNDFVSLLSLHIQCERAAKGKHKAAAESAHEKVDRELMNALMSAPLADIGRRPVEDTGADHGVYDVDPKLAAGLLARNSPTVHLLPRSLSAYLKPGNASRPGV